MRDRQIIDNLKEEFVVVDREGRLVGKATRGECHKKGLLHRAISVAIFNKDSEILLQKRSRGKDLYPGEWTVSASGHVGWGETREEAAKRELWEELGVRTNLKRVARLFVEVKTDRELIVLFKGFFEGPFKINKEEIEKVEFFNPKKAYWRWKKREMKLTPGGKAVLEYVVKNSGKFEVE